MASTRAYKLWVYDAGSSVWRELERFTGLKFAEFLNMVPIMEATVYTNNATIQGLLSTTKPYFRITKTDSTTGANGTIILTGVLSEPRSEEKTAVANNLPVVFQLSGKGMWDAITYNYDTETTFNTTISSIVTSLIAAINSQAGSTVVVAGTLSASTSVNVTLRKDKIMQLIVDLASIGNTSAPYYVRVLTDSSLRPEIHVRDSSTGYTTSNPFSPRDEARIIDEKTEARLFTPIDERDRIRNAVKVRYGGLGTGVTQAESTQFTESTSITNFGRRESIVLAPFIRDSATAAYYASTLRTTFAGGSDGMTRYEVQMKDPTLFSSSFSANLGDVIGVELRDGRQVTGRYNGHTYDQDEELLTIHIGIPRVHFREDVASMERIVKQIGFGMKSAVQRSVPLLDDDITRIVSLSGAVTLTAGATATVFDTTLPADWHTADGYQVYVGFTPNSAPDSSVDSHTHDLGNHVHNMNHYHAYDKANSPTGTMHVSALNGTGDAPHSHALTYTSTGTGGPFDIDSPFPSMPNTEGPSTNTSGATAPGLLVNGPFVIALIFYNPSGGSYTIAKWTIGHLRTSKTAEMTNAFLFGLPSSSYSKYKLTIENQGEITVTLPSSGLTLDVTKKLLHVHDV